MSDDSTRWTAICHTYDTIRVDSYAYGFGDEWEALVADTRAGSATTGDWTRFLADVDNAAAGSLNLISKGDPLQRRLAAVRATSGDFVCATGRCRRRESALTADAPPQCVLFDRQMIQG